MLGPGRRRRDRRGAARPRRRRTAAAPASTAKLRDRRRRASPRTRRPTGSPRPSSPAPTRARSCSSAAATRPCRRRRPGTPTALRGRGPASATSPTQLQAAARHGHARSSSTTRCSPARRSSPGWAARGRAERATASAITAVMADGGRDTPGAPSSAAPTPDLAAGTRAGRRARPAGNGRSRRARRRPAPTALASVHSAPLGELVAADAAGLRQRHRRGAWPARSPLAAHQPAIVHRRRRGDPRRARRAGRRHRRRHDGRQRAGRRATGSARPRWSRCCGSSPTQRIRGCGHGRRRRCRSPAGPARWPTAT